MARKVNAAFKYQARQVIKKFRESAQGRYSAAILEGIAAGEPRMAATFRQYYARMFDLGVSSIRQTIGKKKQDVLTPFEILREEYVQETTATKVKGISSYSFKRIKESIRFGLDAGMGHTELSYLLESALPDILSPGRAQTIGRTEIHNAFENSSLAAAKEAQLPMLKTWMITPVGKRNRLGHRAMEGKSVPLDSTFQVPLYNSRGALVSIDNMQGPGDRNAPAGQIVNCGCSLVFEPDI